MALVERIHQHFVESIELQQSTSDLLSVPTAAAAELLVGALMADHKILVCGNGGSAADAQRFVSELLGRFERERPELAAIALTTNNSIITSIGNDFDFDMIFSKQIRGLGRPGDVLLAISTSGNSENIVEAIHAAHDRQMPVIALTGKDGGKVGEMVSGDDILLIVPSNRTARIQEIHLLLLHALCDAVDFILLDGE